MKQPVALAPASLAPTDTFARRHIGSDAAEQRAMLQSLGLDSLEQLVAQAVPAGIRCKQPLRLRGLPTDRSLGESEALARLRRMADKNVPHRSYLGMGYYDTHTPGVIARNILADPGWYTQYTPYQAEVAQGRLEALLNFQTMVSELCGLPLANASLLDEGTAAAEAMAMLYAKSRGARDTFFVADHCHPQTIAVLQTRAEALGITVQVGAWDAAPLRDGHLFGMLVQYPDTHGHIADFAALADALHAQQAYLVVATCLLACTVLRPPGEFGADVAIGSAQRFGVPLGYGGPHAAFYATQEHFKRLLPGRIIGVSKDCHGNPALRMAMQTREQHIRREKATSNICTAQALLAIVAGMYGVYHGPQGLQGIARRVQGLCALLAQGLRTLGYRCGDEPFFDTLVVRGFPDGLAAGQLGKIALRAGINLRLLQDDAVSLSLDETTGQQDVEKLWQVFAAALPQSKTPPPALQRDAELARTTLPDLGLHARDTPPLRHPVFQQYHSEHAMLRYITRLRGRDLSLAQAMIPLGSCTMKLNATAEMEPIAWPQFAGVHPFAPPSQSPGYAELMDDLRTWLAEITGFAAVSLQPNAGAQGEYAGLMVIRRYHRSRGDAARKVCLIPVSAHGTNPASAMMAGLEVVIVACDAAGNVDVADLTAKAEAHAPRLAALMITYPSTHGVFEAHVAELCSIVHAHGGQVYLDGANMNAQVALCRPGDYGADVCHLNLHKTFCIPHGGGGPGVGPIGVAAHLADFLPRHPLVDTGGADGMGPVAAAPFGSAGILPISWMYIAMMGSAGLQQATSVAILHANYMAARLADHYPILYRGAHGRVAHEFILDTRPFKQSCGVEAEDIAKRLIDYGFHAPTMSFPVAGTLMIEPTESEPKAEIDRFCAAMIAIREEIAAVEAGHSDRLNNPLKQAPHTAAHISGDSWDHPYGRTQAAYPVAAVHQHKFWPAVGRIDNAYGDRNLMCTCPPMASYL